MPSITSDSWVRICDCWCDGNTSMMRLIVDDAELVCSVPNVRWPVSAMRSAASTVSRSRVSPISTTSGSSRSAARRALVKLWVSLCTSRWLTMQPLCWCRYSIGSSMVVHVAAEARHASNAERKVQFQRLFKTLLLGVGQHAVGKRLAVRGRERRLRQPAQLPVHAHLRRAVDGQMEVGRAQFDGRLQQFRQ